MLIELHFEQLDSQILQLNRRISTNVAVPASYSYINIELWTAATEPAGEAVHVTQNDPSLSIGSRGAADKR